MLSPHRVAARVAMAESVASNSVRGSVASDKLEKGPVMLHGMLFLKIKRCPFCLMRNCDDNLIRSGPFGPDFSAFQVWAKGSATKPEGQVDKVCQLAFVHGGFAAQFGGSVEAFLDARRKDPQLNKEWQSAVAAVVEILEESSAQRLGKNILAEMEAVLKGAREKAVEAFKKNQKRVIAPYRCILKEKYEKAFPGRIAEMGLTCRVIDTEAGKAEVVLIRKLPEGEWDLNFEDVVGVGEREILDDGSNQLRARQSEYKYHDLVSRSRLSKDEIAAAAKAANVESPEKNGAEPGTAGCSEDDASSDASGQDTMDWAIDCNRRCSSGEAAKRCKIEGADAE